MRKRVFLPFPPSPKVTGLLVYIFGHYIHWSRDLAIAFQYIRSSVAICSAEKPCSRLECRFENQDIYLPVIISVRMNIGCHGHLSCVYIYACIILRGGSLPVSLGDAASVKFGLRKYLYSILVDWFRCCMRGVGNRRTGSKAKLIVLNKCFKP